LNDPDDVDYVFADSVDDSIISEKEMAEIPANDA
jgi:hypothetical protein